jgi:hypothetical protein
MYGSLEKCEVSYATIQGIDCLLAKFRNTVVMEEIHRYRPKLWYHIDSTEYLLADCRNLIVVKEIHRYRPKLWYHIDSTDLPTFAGVRNTATIKTGLSKLGTTCTHDHPQNQEKAPNLSILIVSRLFVSLSTDLNLSHDQVTDYYQPSCQPQ